MGNFDYNNYVVEVSIRENLTDTRYIDFMKKDDYTLSDFKQFEASLKSLPYNTIAEKIVRFFIEYKSGVLLPDKFDAAEPIRKIFEPNDISIPVSFLSNPAGGLYLLKKRNYSATIDNKYYAIIFEDIDGEYHKLKPKRILPEYMTIIRVIFSIHKNTDIQFLVDLMHDLKAYLNTDYGKVYIQSNNEIIAE